MNGKKIHFKATYQDIEIHFFLPSLEQSEIFRELERIVRVAGIFTVFYNILPGNPRLGDPAEWRYVGFDYIKVFDDSPEIPWEIKYYSSESQAVVAPPFPVD